MNSQGSITTNDLNAYPNESSINGNKLNSRIRHFKALTSLSLWGTKVTDEGLKELKDLGKLTSLDLGNTQVTDVGLKELKELKGLHTLNLSGTQVTDAGLKTLREIGLLHVLPQALAKHGRRPVTA